MNTSHRSRLSQWGFLWGFVALTSLLTLLINVFGFGHNWLSYRLLGGLINPTLLANIVLLTVIVAGYLLGVGKVSLRQLGVHLEQLLPAVGFTVALWLVSNLVVASVGLATNSLQWHPMWTQQGVLTVLGWLIGQLFGNALYEEIAYRGFLLTYTVSLSAEAVHTQAAPAHQPQSQPRLRQRSQLILAILASQLLFALIHMPNRLVVDGLPLGNALLSLLPLWLLGLMFAWSYWHTGNLLLVVGVHALLNTPTLLVSNTSRALNSYLLLAVALLGIATYPWWFKNTWFNRWFKPNCDQATALEPTTLKTHHTTNHTDAEDLPRGMFEA